MIAAAEMDFRIAGSITAAFGSAKVEDERYFRGSEKRLSENYFIEHYLLIYSIDRNCKSRV